VLTDRGFFGPTQYERFIVYLVVGVLLLALVVAWYVFVVRFSRSRVPKPVVVRAAPVDLGVLRTKYARMIDEVDAAYASGALGERAVHSRLSLLLRFFAYEAAGVDAQVMTLSDLRSTDLPSVTSAVEEYYPPAFQEERQGDPEGAVRRAREVVLAWN
jgi:hypothetical protein